MSDSIEGTTGGADGRPDQGADHGVGVETQHGAAAPSYDAAEPRPLGVERTPTGDAGVDGQLARLADADHLPADGHVEVYEDVHRGLRDALTALDVRPGPQGPPAPPATTHAYDHRS